MRQTYLQGRSRDADVVRGCVDVEWAGGGDGMNWEPGPDIYTTAMCKTDNQWEAVTAPEAQLHALR